MREAQRISIGAGLSVCGAAQDIAGLQMIKSAAIA